MARRADRSANRELHHSSQKATDRFPVAAAFGVSLGALVMAGLVALIIHVSSLRSSNGNLRVLANAAEEKSRDQARRLLDELGRSSRRGDAASANSAATQAPSHSPASPSLRRIVTTPELAPPLSRAVFAPIDQRSPTVQSAPAPAVPTQSNPHDTIAIARFLLSEHDLGIAEPPPHTTPPILRPPALAQPVIAADPPAASASTARQPTASNSKRRQAGVAECNAINEQVQLRDLTERDRIFLQEFCR